MDRFYRFRSRSISAAQAPSLRHRGRCTAELWIDLNLRSQPIIKSGHEQIGVDDDPVLDPLVEHRPLPPSGFRHTHERSRI